MASRLPHYPEPLDSASSAEPAHSCASTGKPPLAREFTVHAERPAAAPAPAANLREFLAELLVEQQRLQTPVAQFSALHDFSPSAFQSFSPSRLIPLSAPRAGEQYAFEVDLDACSGCKSCVSACHALNGLDETETWRDTGLLLGGESHAPVLQTITTACHHCEDPGCLNGCPVLAYEKDPLTGIVRHLDDQCIGCQYCILKCPYDVPKYNARLGIVRKCDLCHQRLAHGEAPACAQACPTQAIRLIVVTTSDSAAALAKEECPDVGLSLANAIVERAGMPGAASPQSRIQNPPARSASAKSRIEIPFPGPDPTYTRPTTRYVTARALPREMRAADAAALRPQHAHWPLVLMLTLLPWAIVLQTLLLTPLAALPPSAAPLDGGAPVATPNGLAGIVTYYVTMPPGLVGLLPLALGALGLAAATFHLGQPLRAWRIFLGLRTSWFSREAVLFGAWFGGTAALTLAPGLMRLPVLAPLLERWPDLRAAQSLGAFAIAGAGVAAVGLAGLVCSVMIYVDTRRSFWRASFTAPRFFLGGTLLALATLALHATSLNGLSAAGENLSYYGKFSLALVLLAKVAVELASLRGESASARLQRGPFVGVLCVRLGLAAGAVAAFMAVLPAAAEPVLGLGSKGALAIGLLLAGEIAERYLFFRAVDAPKMPGYATR